MEKLSGNEALIANVLINVSEKLVIEKIRNNDTKWTRDILTALCKLAYDSSYSVYTSKANDHDNTTNEYLYDMMWFTPENEENRIWDLKEIHMVLESEWNRSIDAIKYDFYKLIQARAELRVMIFQSSDVHSIMNELEEIVQESNISASGDKFLLAGWSDESGFSFELVIKK